MNLIGRTSSGSDNKAIHGMVLVVNMSSPWGNLGWPQVGEIQVVIGDRKRSTTAGVPIGIKFATKTETALEQLEQFLTEGRRSTACWPMRATGSTAGSGAVWTNWGCPMSWASPRP